MNYCFVASSPFHSLPLHTLPQFVHGGHTQQVNDLSWSCHSNWFIGSVDDNNMLQVWQVADNIINGDDDDEEGDANADDLE